MIHPTPARLHALAALTTLVLAACGGGGSDAPADPAPPPPTTGPVTPTPVTPPPPPAPTALELSTRFLAAYDQSYATAPATGAESAALLDGCYLGDGANKQFLATNYDATGAAARGNNYSRGQRQPNVGAKRTNIQVLDDRKTTNADGSARREIDVQYDVVYTDGTTAVGGKTTLIAGSSSGSCATPDSRSDLRFFGNRRQVNVQVVSRNQETASFGLSDGNAKTPNLSYRREVRFNFRDPGNVATYMIVTGPGVKPPSGKPFSLKMLSPRILRDAPELAGRTGSANYIDSDTFALCLHPTSSTELPDATVADCAAFGASGDSIGRTLNGPVDPARTADADARFSADGWVAGGVYTISVYADDGWKTIGGQNGKTPIATYTETLETLPYSFAQMQNPPAQYPRITNTSLTMAQIAEAARTTGGTVQLTWQKAQPPANGKPMGLLSASVFADGIKSGSSTGWPRVREFEFFFPGLNQLTANVPFTGKNPATDNKRYQNFSLYYGDRNSNVIQYTLQFF